MLQLSSMHGCMGAIYFSLLLAVCLFCHCDCSQSQAAISNSDPTNAQLVQTKHISFAFFRLMAAVSYLFIHVLEEEETLDLTCVSRCTAAFFLSLSLS
jgi:hypothetical protein